MYSLLTWLGVGVFLVGFVGVVRPGWVDFDVCDGVILGLALFLLPPLHFAYLHRIRPPDNDIPEGNVAFAPAFVAENEQGRSPGTANQKLAEWLAGNAKKFSKILTQEAIIWALEKLDDYVPNPKPNDLSLAGHLCGVPVYRMHLHVPGANVRTLEALCFALGRFAPNYPPVIVLVAHEKQYERTYRDLHSLYKGKGRIVQPYIEDEKVGYWNNKFLNPLLWALREVLIARPLEFVQRTLFRCHPNLNLERLPIG